MPITPTAQTLASQVVPVTTPGGGTGGGPVSISGGTGISVTPNPITGTGHIDNTGVTSIIAGAGILVDQATGDVTVTNTATGGGATVDCYGYTTGSQTCPGAFTEYVVHLDIELFKHILLHSNVTNNTRITIPSGQGGTYAIVGQVNFNATGAGNALVAIKLNGGNYISQQEAHIGSALLFPLNTSIIYEFTGSGSEYIELACGNDIGSLNVLNGTDSTFLSIVKVQASGGIGTVTSVDGSGGTTGLTVIGGPVTTAGTLTLGGVLNMANGGFGASVASGRGYPLFRSGTFAFDGQYINGKAYGCVGDGSTNDQAALQSTITAAAALSPRCTVYLPSGKYRVNTGLFNLTALLGLKIIGEGPESTIIDIHHASNSLFLLNTDAGFGNQNIELSNLSITSGVTRTGGWVIDSNMSIGAPGELIWCQFNNLFIENQLNGIRLTQFAECRLHNIQMTGFVGTTGTGIQLGQASSGAAAGRNMIMSDITIAGDSLGTTAPSCNIGILLWNVGGISAVNCSSSGCVSNNWKIQDDAGADSGPWSFTNCSSDQNKSSHGFYITGTGQIDQLQFNNCYFAEAGLPTGGSVNANGVRIDATTSSTIGFNGCTFVANQGAGLYITASPTTNIVGCAFELNGRSVTLHNKAEIYVNSALNVGAVNIIGNTIVSTGTNPPIETTATSNRVGVANNMMRNAPIYGIAPQFSSPNGVI